MYVFIKNECTTAKETFDWIDRVNDRVCTNGQFVELVFDNEFQLNDANGRGKLTAQDACAFIRNYADEGFDAEIRIDFGA